MILAVYPESGKQAAGEWRVSRHECDQSQAYRRGPRQALYTRLIKARSEARPTYREDLGMPHCAFLVTAWPQASPLIGQNTEPTPRWASPPAVMRQPPDGVTADVTPVSHRAADLAIVAQLPCRYPSSAAFMNDQNAGDWLVEHD